MKKLNFLMLFALVFLLLGCRHDVMNEEHNHSESSSFQKIIKLKDIPALKNIISVNPHLLSNDYTIEADDNIKVLHIENDEHNSYSIQFVPPNINSFYTLIVNYNKQEDNKETYTLIEFVPKDKRGNADINNFSGKVLFKTLNGRILLRSTWENGKIIEQVNDDPLSKTSCYTDYNVVEVWCSEHIHPPSQYGECRAPGKPYYTISSTLKCDQESIDSGDGGGGSFGGGGGIGGGLGIWDILLPYPDIKNLYMSLPTSIQIPVNNYYQENENRDFAYFAISFFANNSNMSWTQFERIFLTPKVGNDGGNDFNILDYDNIQVQQKQLPKFSLMNQFYLRDPNNQVYGMPSNQVYEKVGGQLYSSHLSNPSSYNNACAIRISRSLNYSGQPVSIFIDKFGQQKSEKGADNLNYILTAEGMLAYMLKNYPAPSYTYSGSNLKDVYDKIKGKNGIYIIIPNVRSELGASGHADLFYTNDCLTGGCHLGLPSGGSVYFWELFN